MRYLTIILLLFLGCLITRAQEMRKIEIDLSYGRTKPINNFHNGEKLFDSDFGLEIRNHTPDLKWSAGILLNMSTAAYKFYDSSLTAGYFKELNSSLNLMLTGDYNVNKGGWINPFIGIGLGPSICDVSLTDILDKAILNDSNEGVYCVIRPRVGLELFKHVRISLFSTIVKSGYNNWGISISGVIGVKEFVSDILGR